MEINFTSHALKRCQQRGIHPIVAKFILDNGESLNSHLDKKYYISKNKLRKLFFSNREFIKKHDKEITSTRVVANEGTIITVMKSIKPIKKG